MSNGKRPDGQKNWEHSRYRDWRPSYREEEKSRGRRRRVSEDEPRRRGSFLGWLLRFCLSIAIIVLLFGPGLDYVNGRSKAAEGACAIRMVVDGDTLYSGCPDGGSLPVEVAGYNAPELFRPGCLDEVGAALMASLELRKALFSADRIVLQTRVERPEPVETPAVEDVGEEVGDDAGSDAAPTPAPVPASGGTPRSGLRVLVDGQDLAEMMLASNTVQPVGSRGWCR